MSISSAKLLEPMEHPCKHCAQHHSVTTAPHHHHQQHHQQAHHSQPGIGTSVVLSTTTTTAHRYRPNEATPTGAFTIIASPALRQATDQCSSITKNHQTASTASDGVTSGATTVPQPQIIVVDDFEVDSNHQQMILAGHGSDAWTCRWLSSPSHRCSHASNAQSCCVSTVASDVHCYSSHNQITSISGDRLAKVTRSPSATQSPPPITCIHARSSRLVRAGGCYAEPEALVATRVPSTTASFANCPSFSASSQSPSSRQRQHTVAKQRPVTSATSVAVTFSNLILFCMVFIAFGMGGRNGTVYASDLARSSTNFSKLSTEEGICQSRDVRNSPENFKQLEGCRVIEGFLMISLMDRYNESHYENWSFPLLTEITDFLLVYRVNGLKTLMKLFPNLRIIRGNQLIKDYALIVYEMMHLTEIGLKSLTQITRGGVRIEKNPMLCYVETINWTAITTTGADHFISANKPQNECPVCASVNSTNDAFDQAEICPPQDTTQGKKGLCWNRQNCQRICPSKCGNASCTATGECCDGNCLICNDNDPKKCEVCRYLSVGEWSNFQCMEKCPSNTFKHQNRRCISEKQCQAVPKPISVNLEWKLPALPYIPFQDECMLDCPPTYYADGESGNRHCKVCVGKCKKECQGGTIDSFADAQRYRGCSHIKGALTIQIRSQGGQNVVKELELALSDVEVIDGFLKIIRSYPIVSLNFFKKLTRISGNILDSDNYGLYVMDNQNIQSLFPHNVTIERGRLFFHFNPKLCPSNIDQLKPFVRALKPNAPFAPEDVAKNSNGDKVACEMTMLNATMKRVRSLGAIIALQPMSYDDPRSLLGYVVYYMVAPSQNVTLYDGRDACGGDGWKVEDVQNVSSNATSIDVFLSHLRPYTQYAYYIKTYTVAAEQKGGQTAIQYFRTKPDRPEEVRNMQTQAKSSSEIEIKWDPPKRANGNLTSYVIFAELVPDDGALLEQRNYCMQPLGDTTSSKKPHDTPPPPEPKPKEKAETCNCDDYNGDFGTKLTEREAELVIEFENELHNTIYVKNEYDSSDRRRRDIRNDKLMRYSRETNEAYSRDGSNTSLLVEAAQANYEIRLANGTIYLNNTGTIDMDKNEKADIKNGSYYVRVYREVNISTQSFVLQELRHYSSYKITVQACRESVPADITEKIENCSHVVISQQRTKMIDHADYITDLAISKGSVNGTQQAVIVKWSPPYNPNGVILSYTIRYSRDQQNYNQYYCITDNEYRTKYNNGYPVPHLVNGNYTFSVMVTTLAGSGQYSAAKHIIVDESFWTTRNTILVIFGVLGLIGLISGGYWWFRRKFGPPDSGLKLIASVNPEYVSMQYTPDEWEISRDKIIRLRELGQGSFGMVYEGILDERDRCAIKTVNENATDRERINFLKEASVMKGFDTHHVVRLLGVVSRGQPTLVVMELMVNGDLKGYLRLHRPETDTPNTQPPSLRRILQMAIEIADGMAYLAAKKFVHRDLAARNCMVAEDLTVKIGDFGMTRDIYETDYYRKGTKGLLPVRWMAPESLKDGVFSTSSDVFSFGIVLWEMATLASQPYQGLSNDQVLRYVIDGGVMERPENCPEKLYSMMIKCWQHRPTGRPTFMQIVTILLDDASSHFRNLSFYHSGEGQELLQLAQHQLLEQVDVRTPLRAEEENFSVGAEEEDHEDPNSFLMEQTNLGQNAGPSHSPLRHSGGSLTVDHSITNIPDVALNQSRNDSSILNMINSPQAPIALQMAPGRNGINLNRGIGILRNTLFGNGQTTSDGSNGSGGSNGCDSKDYKLLNHSMNSQSDQYVQQIN